MSDSAPLILKRRPSGFASVAITYELRGRGTVWAMAGSWPFVGRSSELERIESLVGSGVGVLLLGEAGVGKTALARQVELWATGLGMPVGRVVGHAVSQGESFEAFAGFVTAADVGELRPVDVARRVADTFAPTAAGRVLFVVDDAQLLDDRSAQVLLQLAADGTATVLATARDLDLPAAIGRLWRENWCERIELRGLADTDVTQILEEALGGPVDPAAVRAFTTRAEGNPLLLRELVRAARDASTLVRRGPAWVLVAQAPLSGGIHELVVSRLDALPDTHRGALEVIAAGEPLPVAVAAELVGETLLDELDADRLISVRPGLAGPEVSTAHPLHGEVLRAHIPPLRLHRLHLVLAGKLEAAGRGSPHDLVRAALWRLDGGQVCEPERLLTAARAARALNLELAEQLARRAHELAGSLQATLLLAEILTHTGRGAEAVRLTATLPPDSLSTADRDALVYCNAVGEGLMLGDAAGGASIVAGVLAGDAAASDQLRGLHASLLAFDARFTDALTVATPLLTDLTAHPVGRTFAALGAVGAHYWLGQAREAVDLAESLIPVAATVRDAVPFGAAGIELIAICALIDLGELDRAEQRARRMQGHAAADADGFTGARGEYCLARVDLARGRPATALRGLGRCLAALTAFDRTFERHICSMLARAATTLGDVDAARGALDDCANAPRMTTYEPEFELAVAALHAAQLDMARAADHAAWAAGMAADRSQWNVALAGYHDAARYGAARAISIPIRDAATHVDGTFAKCLFEHAAALAARDPVALDDVACRFQTQGAVLFAAEACTEAALFHTRDGHPRRAQASTVHAARLRADCEGAVSPWLAGAAALIPLTARERQITALAADGRTDAAIATHLAISIRTVQTHLGRVYTKLGITSRSQISDHLT